MKPYTEMTREELREEFARVTEEYKKFQSMDLHLDMSRGKPCTDQLNLSMGLMDALNSDADMTC